ncbi:MAG TPA: hypothetical protein VF773_10735 [Verrucomicrobiae bacterium]
MKNTLKPIALALPGLLAMSSFAAWTPYYGGSGNGFSSAASVLGSGEGYTEAKYQGSSLACTRYWEWTDRNSVSDDRSVAETGTLVIQTGTWSESSYSYGYVRVFQTSAPSNEGWAYVQSNI